MFGLGTIFNRNRNTQEIAEPRSYIVEAQPISTVEQIEPTDVRIWFATDEADGDIYLYGVATAIGPDPYAVFDYEAVDCAYVDFGTSADWYPLWCIEAVAYDDYAA